MSTVKNLCLAAKSFWLQHRFRFFSILFWPTVVSLIIFVIGGVCEQVMSFAAGFASLREAITWVIHLLGTLVTPGLVLRAGVALLYENDSAFSITVSCSVRGAILTKFETSVLAVVLLLGALGLNSHAALLSALKLVYGIASAFILIFWIPMMVIGFIVHWVRAFRSLNGGGPS